MIGLGARYSRSISIRIYNAGWVFRATDVVFLSAQMRPLAEKEAIAVSERNTRTLQSLDYGVYDTHWRILIES